MLSVLRELESYERLLAVLGIAIFAHFALRLIRSLSERVLSKRKYHRPSTKARTVISLATSVVAFAVYFGAVGFAVTEAGLSLSTYLASASIIGFAVAFGSQGVIQDLLTGITFIFSDLFDVGDMVEIGNQAGIVQRLGMRFTVLANPLGAEVFIPNRSITNVINYPRGYVRCLADVTVSADPEVAGKMETAIRNIANGIADQFPGILRTPPDFEGRQTTASGRAFYRVKFRIWPGRSGPIETVFRQEVLQAVKTLDETYADWMITINNEVEGRVVKGNEGR